MAQLNATQKITTVILAAKLAREVLDLVTIGSADLARFQFRQIVADFKLLDDHLKTLGAAGEQ